MQRRVIHLDNSSTDDGLDMELLVRRQLELLNEDPDCEGLLKTPERDDPKTRDEFLRFD